MPERVAWTPEGRARLAAQDMARVESDPRKISAAIRKVTPAWKKGLAKSGDLAPRVKRALAWKPSREVDIRELAAVVAIASMADSGVALVAEWIATTHGAEIALRVLIEMWPLAPVTNYKGTSWLLEQEPDAQNIHDVSSNRARRHFAHYLAVRLREAPERGALCAALWPTTPSYARTPLAIACEDADHAALAAVELLAADEPYPYYPWEELPHVLRDAKLVAKVMKRDGQRPSIFMVETIGVKVIPILVDHFAKHMDNSTRLWLMQIAENLESPRIAKILAEYAGQAPYAGLVRNYFTRFPKLLKQVLRDPELRYYHDDLRAIHQTTP